MDLEPSLADRESLEGKKTTKEAKKAKEKKRVTPKPDKKAHTIRRYFLMTPRYKVKDGCPVDKDQRLATPEDVKKLVETMGYLEDIKGIAALPKSNVFKLSINIPEAYNIQQMIDGWNRLQSTDMKFNVTHLNSKKQ